LSTHITIVSRKPNWSLVNAIFKILNLLLRTQESDFESIKNRQNQNEVISKVEKK